MSWTTIDDYGTCPCGPTSVYRNRVVEVRMARDDDLVTLESVPQGGCDNCGSRVYKLAQLELIEDLMHHRQASRTP